MHADSQHRHLAVPHDVLGNAAQKQMRQSRATVGPHYDPRFCAFDLLFLNGRDLRKLPLVERKAKLHKIIPPQPSRVLFCDYIEARGEELFAAACTRDLEGIVAKWKQGKYVDEPEHPWIKIKNPAYSQIQGRHEQFDRMRKRAAAAGK